MAFMPTMPFAEIPLESHVDVPDVLAGLPPLPSEWSFWATWSLGDTLNGGQADAQLMGSCRTLPEFVNELAKLPLADLPVNVTINAIRQPVPQHSPAEVGVISVYCPCRTTADRFWQRLALSAGAALFPAAAPVTVLAVSVSNQPTTTLTEMFVAPDRLGYLPIDALKAEIRQIAGEVGMKTFTIGVKTNTAMHEPRRVPSPVRQQLLPLAA